MGKLKHVLVMLCLFGVGIWMMHSACTTGPGTNEGGSPDSGAGTDVVAQDTTSPTPDTPTPPGDTPANPDTPATPDVPAEPTGPITMTFDPPTGSQLDVDGAGACVKVTFNYKPCSKSRKAELKQDGASVDTPTSFDADPKDPKKATICALSVLRQDAKYTLAVTVLENVKDCATAGKPYTETLKYTTKAPYKNDPPPPAGVGINLRLDKISKPNGVGDLISGVNPDQIPPILVVLHSLSSSDGGKTGDLTFVGGLGKAPPGGKPHQGKDVIDNDKNPVSLALHGKFEGRAFHVGPTTFLLAISGIALRIDNFSLTGIFTKDGKNVEFANLTGILDPALIQKQFGLDICQLLAGECFKGPDGKDRVLIAGTVKGIENPFPFSAFVTTPVYLSTEFPTDQKAEFYTTEGVEEKDLTFLLSKCSGSTDEQKPCDPGKGAKIEPVAGGGKIELGTSKTQGYYTPDKLEAATWYKLEFEAKNAKAIAFKTFTLFKTK